MSRGKSQAAGPSVDRISMQAYPERDEHEETKGLLSGEQVKAEEEPEPRSSWSRRRITVLGAGFICLLLGATFLPPLLRTTYVADGEEIEKEAAFRGSELRSNGTHDFKRTVLVVSIDGLRADYLDRGLTPHLLEISHKGLRAKYMKPVFPTLTFPNHWALMTGLYAESHGIVANNFFDPETGHEFVYNTAATSWNASWWLGEPMWETAGKADIITANLMWPGPPQTSRGGEPTYFIPWRNHVSLSEKLDQVMAWIDMPLEDRPQLIHAYEPSLDQAGHLAGPNSELVNTTLAEVDVFARDLHAALEARNLTEIVDIVFLSDHGMTDTSNPEFVYLDAILGEGYADIEHEDGWPSKGLRFRPSANVSHYLGVLQAAAQDPAVGRGKFDVYTHESMPAKYHYAGHPRIAPVYVVPRIGYSLTTKMEGGWMDKGTHGYDNDEPAMYAMFVAHGPFAAAAKVAARRRRSLLARALGNPNKGWHSTAGDAYVMDGFANVEVYGLVMRLLGIQDKAAPTNGTSGFWERYF